VLQATNPEEEKLSWRGFFADCFLRANIGATCAINDTFASDSFPWQRCLETCKRAGFGTLIIEGMGEILGVEGESP
jgi:hypothetical protein